MADECVVMVDGAHHLTSLLVSMEIPQGWLWKENGIQRLDQHGAIDSLSHVAPSFILATSPALLGFVIGPPNSTDGLSGNEWFLARRPHPLFRRELVYFLTISSVFCGVHCW